MDAHAVLLYDAVMLYGYALNDALADNQELNESSVIYRYLTNRTFEGK